MAALPLSHSHSHSRTRSLPHESGGVHARPTRRDTALTCRDTELTHRDARVLRQGARVSRRGNYTKLQLNLTYTKLHVDLTYTKLHVDVNYTQLHLDFPRRPSLSAAGAGQTILIGTYRHVVLGVACRVSGGRLIVRHAVAKANVVQVDVARSYLQCAVKTAQRRPAQLHRQRRSVCNAVNLLEYLRTSHCPPHASLELSELYTALTTPSLQKNTFSLMLCHWEREARESAREGERPDRELHNHTHTQLSESIASMMLSLSRSAAGLTSDRELHDWSPCACTRARTRTQCPPPHRTRALCPSFSPQKTRGTSMRCFSTSTITFSSR